jgi:hypothetical protein
MRRALLGLVAGGTVGTLACWTVLVLWTPHTSIDAALAKMVAAAIAGGVAGLLLARRRSGQ